MQIKVVGPRDPKQASVGTVINTTSHTTEDWQRDFSPFFLGPIPLYDGRRAIRMENAWQYTKVYAEHLDEQGNPSQAYWEWASKGWSKFGAVRYPMGKGAKPAYVWWDGEKLPYVDSRLRVYFPLYRDAVRQMPGFARLQQMANEGPVTLFDFDGYDHEALGLSLRQVFLNPTQPMGHAFVLKAMLLYGPDVQFEDIDDSKLEAPALPQMSMF
jgi:hypothetical protein